MTRRLTLARLLLGVILINIVLTALFVFTVAGSLPWLSHLLPGEFGFGVQFWGNYVFLSVAVLVNAILVLGAGLAVVLPAIWDEDPAFALEQIRAARWIFRIGALLFVLSFPAVCFTYARALPDGSMFVDAKGTVKNSQVAFNDVALFTADQFIDVVSVDAPEIYGRALGPLRQNPANPWMPLAVLVFRVIVTLIAITTLLAVLRQSALTRFEKARAEKTKPAETKATRSAAAADQNLASAANT